MPQRLRRATRPAIALACMLALALSFVLARPGGGTERSDPAGVPGPAAIPGTEPVSAPAAPRLGRARELPALARDAPKPKPPKRKRAAARPAAPAPARRPGGTGADARPRGARARVHAAARARGAATGRPGAGGAPRTAGRSAPGVLRRLGLMADSPGDSLARAVRARVSLRHRGLLPARVVRDDAGRLRIQLQRHEAPTLAEVLAGEQLGRRDAIVLVYGVAAAAEALRRAGLVARDLRPSRILVSPTNGAVLADSGIPLELMPRTVRPGDPDAAFRSPEELATGHIDARSNVYSLGVLLRAVLDPSGGSELPTPVEAVIERASATDPELRHATPKELMVATADAVGLRIRSRPGGGAELALTPRDSATPSGGGAPAPRPRPAPPRARPAVPRPARPPSPPSRPQPNAEPAASETPPREREAVPSHEPPAPRPRPPAPPPRREPSRPRIRVPSMPRPRMPRISVPSVPRPRMPHISVPSIPRPRMPRVSTPSLPRPRIPSPPRLHLRVPSLPATLRPARIGRAVAVGLALLASVTAGLMLAKAGGEDDGAAQISSAALSVQLPGDWDGTKVDREPSIPLAEPLAAAPEGERGTGLVAGRVDDAVALDKRLRTEGRRTEVSLGRLEAWRYSGIEPQTGLAAVAFLAPTSDGSVLVICHARRAVAPQRLRECEGIASTIALRGGRPVALATIGEGEQVVNELMAALRSARVRGRRELARARRAPGQAQAARGLAKTYRAAAERVERSPEIDGEAGELAESLRAAGSAYGDLAAAAARGNRERYRAARRAVVEREAAVERGAAEPLSA